MKNSFIRYLLPSRPSECTNLSSTDTTKQQPAELAGKTRSLALLSGDHTPNPHLRTRVCKPALCRSLREHIQAKSHSDRRGEGEAHWKWLLSFLRRPGGVNHISRLWGRQGLNAHQVSSGWETAFCLYSPYPHFTTLLRPSLDSQEFLLLYLLRDRPAHGSTPLCGPDLPLGAPRDAQPRANGLRSPSPPSTLHSAPL